MVIEHANKCFLALSEYVQSVVLEMGVIPAGCFSQQNMKKIATNRPQTNENQEGNNKEKPIEPGGTFCCHKCSFEENYHYKGLKPPFCKGVKFLEESYVAKDPFSPPGERSFLLLGSDCSMCGNQICQDSTCSGVTNKDWFNKRSIGGMGNCTSDVLAPSLGEPACAPLDFFDLFFFFRVSLHLCTLIGRLPTCAPSFRRASSTAPVVYSALSIDTLMCRSKIFKPLATKDSLALATSSNTTYALMLVLSAWKSFLKSKRLCPHLPSFPHPSQSPDYPHLHHLMEFHSWDRQVAWTQESLSFFHQEFVEIFLMEAALFQLHHPRYLNLLDLPLVHQKPPLPLPLHSPFAPPHQNPSPQNLRHLMAVHPQDHPQFFWSLGSLS
ncbi:hypothetical protein B566_EDAN009855 [Ephemera danica]|nr:hypothetical protein B566_EDAN009855 [Ephemera danica]